MYEHPIAQNLFSRCLRAAAVGTLLFGLAACASGQRIAVESLANWPDVTRVAEPAPAPMSTAYATLRSKASTFVHSMPDWSDRNLSDREYVLAGADNRPAFWITYLHFEMTGLEPEMFGLRDATAAVASATGASTATDEWQCSNPEFSVTLALSPLTDPPLRGRDSYSELRVYRAITLTPVTEITWSNQPMVTEERAGSGVIRREELESDELNVTNLVCDALEQGAAELLLAVIPFDPSRDLRRRWMTASEYDSTRLPSLIIRSGFAEDVSINSTYPPRAPH